MPYKNKFLFSTTIIIFVFFVFSSGVYGITESELKKQISDKNTQIEQLSREIAEYQNKIAKTSEEAASLAQIIKELNLTKSKLLKERTQIENKINITNIVIEDLDVNIQTKEEIIQDSKKVISSMIYDLYRKDQESFLYKILTQKSFEDLSREYNDLIGLNENLKNNIFKLKGQKYELGGIKEEKLTEKEKLAILKNDLLEKEKAVSVTQREKNNILSETKNKEAEYQKLLKETEAKKQIFEKEMEEYEAELKLLINPKFLPKEGSEVLSWPLDNILITSKYGERVNPFNNTIKTFHYGVDFRASVGTKIKAMAAGVVVDTGNTDISCKGASFGNWVLVKYNNGLSSTFGHLSSISVKKGQKVKTGDTIGLSGGAPGAFGSGSSTGPHLHLSVYASDGVEVASFESKSCPGKILTQPRINRADAHLNPILYLPKTTKNMYKDGVL